jgi:hypothetical protein
VTTGDLQVLLVGTIVLYCITLLHCIEMFTFLFLQFPLCGSWGTAMFAVERRWQGGPWALTSNTFLTNDDDIEPIETVNVTFLSRTDGLLHPSLYLCQTNVCYVNLLLMALNLKIKTLTNVYGTF